MEGGQNVVRRRRMKQKRAKKDREREREEREKRGAFSIVDSIGDPDGTAQTSLLHRYLPAAVILCVLLVRAYSDSVDEHI